LPCLLERIDHPQQQLLLGSHTVSLRFHDDLMLLIDRSHPGVALDHALAGGHLGRVVVGAVALAHLAVGPFALLGVLVQPLAQLLGTLTQPLQAARQALLLAALGGIALRVRGAVVLEDLLHLRLHLRGGPEI
jgi:hypothetical protein